MPQIGLQENSPIPQNIEIGSLAMRAWFQSRADAELLNELFKGTVREPAAADAPAEVELRWRHVTDREPASIPPDSLRVVCDGQVWHIASEILTAQLDLSAPLPQIWLDSYPHTLTEFEWRVHVSVVFHKLLLLLGRLYLHAGAVRVGETASAFIGDKGSGKSTVCLWLGRAGATILSDDHIAIRQRDGIFYASGSELVARVTAETEAALFPHALAEEARDFGGMLKKEFAVGEWFLALPYQDVPLRRVFFPRVGSHWQLNSIPTQKLTARLLETTRKSHRLANKEDYARHLNYFSALARAVEGFDLELSPDLNELERLDALLSL